MAQNTVNNRGEFLTMPAPSYTNSETNVTGGPTPMVGPISGDPLMYGRGTCPGFGLAVVAETSLTPPTGVSTGDISCAFIGVHMLSVVAALINATSTLIAPGDKVYACGGTYDVTTGCLYGFTLRPDPTGAYYGNALDTVVGGQTASIRVRLKVGG